MGITASVGSVATWVIRRERVRFLRMQRHLAVAVVATMVGLLTSPVFDTLGGFVLMSVVVFVVLSSCARALDARLGYLWGWLYGEPVRTTWLDCVVDRMIRRLLRDTSVEEGPAPKVWPIDPASL